jgi:hypothetical protein
MCAAQALAGRPGRLRVAVWVERRTPPLGTMTEIWGLASCLLVYGRSVVMKWPVQPVSAMAKGEGGERALTTNSNSLPKAGTLVVLVYLLVK